MEVFVDEGSRAMSWSGLKGFGVPSKLEDLVLVVVAHPFNQLSARDEIKRLAVCGPLSCNVADFVSVFTSLTRLDLYDTSSTPPFVTILELASLGIETLSLGWDQNISTCESPLPKLRMLSTTPFLDFPASESSTSTVPAPPFDSSTTPTTLSLSGR